MIIHEDTSALRTVVAQACRVLAAKGLVEGILGHVSVRVAADEMLIRCRGPQERGLAHTRAEDVWRVNLSGDPVDLPDGYAPPKELPLHGELLRARPDLGAVVHAHPRSALLCTLAGLQPRAVFGAYDIPAMRMAKQGIPVYERPVLIHSVELAQEMVDAMGSSDVCLLRGHGVTVAGEGVEQATTRTITLDRLLDVTVQLAQLRAAPPEVSDLDGAELPNLGSSFNDALAWQALVAEVWDR